jgi:hypothetical protein
MVKPRSNLRIVTIVTQILLNYVLKFIKITINYKYCCSLNVQLLQLQCFLGQALVSHYTNKNKLLLNTWSDDLEETLIHAKLMLNKCIGQHQNITIFGRGIN